MKTIEILAIVGMFCAVGGLLSAFWRVSTGIKQKLQTSQHTIFLIDESVPMRFILSSVLEKMAKIYSISSIDLLAGYLQSNIQPRIIIIDITNSETFRRAQDILTRYSLEKFTSIIITSTGSMSVAAKEMNAAGYFAKPFDPVNIKVIVSSLLKEKVTNKIPLDIKLAFNPMSLDSRYITNPKLEMSVTKRTIDIFLSLLAITVLFPLGLIITIAILIESKGKGPILYASSRAGQGYRIFKFLKFRTMVVDADKALLSLEHLNRHSIIEGAPVFVKVVNDPRITKVGRFLRNTSLDELPQLLNVLIGDMSLVGNRPLPLYEAASLTTDHFAERFMAPAGITGLWQIKSRGKNSMLVEERINLDIAYAKKGNWVYDIVILASYPFRFLRKKIYTQFSLSFRMDASDKK